MATDPTKKENSMSHRLHFAGINTRPLAAAAKGQDVLISFADIKKSPAFWAWMRPLLEGGHFRSVILDSGAFTELSQRKLGKVFKVSVDEFAAFAAEHQALFTWVANLDDIEGNTEVSNANYQAICAAGVRNVVPVFHEGEPAAQLAHCVELAKAGRGILAVGAQRPKGSLVPSKVVAFLAALFPQLTALDPARTVAVHGFGLTRYASDACPGTSNGFPFDSTDATTWIAEACAVERSGAFKGERTVARAKAFRATIASYSAVSFVVGQADCGGALAIPAGFDASKATEAAGQARTVARRLGALRPQGRLAAWLLDLDWDAVAASTPGAAVALGRASEAALAGDAGKAAR